MQGATSPHYETNGNGNGNGAGHKAGLTNAGVGVAKTVAKGSIKKFFASPLMWLRLVGRGTQFVLALVVCGFYGRRVSSDHRHGDAQSAAWVYALFVAGLSAATAAAFAVPLWRTHRLLAWDLALFVLWIAAFGTFAGKFLSLTDEEAAAYDGVVSVGAMKVAVWLDLLNALLWLGTAAYGFVYGLTVEKGKGFGRLFARKATGKLGDLEANAHGKLNDRFGGTLDEKLDNPVVKGVAGKVGTALKSKAAAKIAARV